MMMVEEEENPDTIYLVPDLLEEIFLRLPLKSVLKFKAVSKQWRSILESRMFVERRMSLPKSRKILAAYNCDCGDGPSLLPESRFEGGEEIVYLHCDCDPARRSMMSCDGLVCFPEADSVNVLNPSTGQHRRFPSAPDPISSRFRKGADWVIGFGKDKVTGSYKVVRMCVNPMEEEFDVLDVESGEWRKLRLPPYVLNLGRQSACVNGSIYWLFMGRLHVGKGYKILALDLHTEEFHNVSVPATWVTRETQVANLEDRLAMAKTTLRPEWRLEICSMNAEEEIWSKTYSISLAGLTPNQFESRWFTPLAVSKQGNLVFCNIFKKLFKYYPETREIRRLSSDVCVISSYLENLVPLPSELGHHPDLQHPDYKTRTSICRLYRKHPEPVSGISRFLKRIRFGTREIVFTTLVIVGYILIRH